MPSTSDNGDPAGTPSEPAWRSGAGDLVAVLDADGRIVECDQASERSLGWTGDQLVGRLVEDLVEPGAEQVVRLSRADGSRAEVTWTERLEQGRRVVRATDLSAQLQIRRERDEARASLQQGYDAAMFLTWEWDVRKDRVNLSIDRVSPRAGASLSFAQAAEHVAESHREVIADALRAVASGLEPSVKLRYPTAETPDGQQRWLECRAAAVHDDEGNVVAVRGSSQDVTEAALAHHDVMQARDFYQATLDSLEARVAVLDCEGRVLALNRAWERFAQDAREVDIGVGANYLDVVAEVTQAGEEHAQAIRAALSAMLREHSSDFMLEFPSRDAASDQWFVLRAARYRAEGPARLVIYHQNISERVHAQRDARWRARLLDEVDAAVIASGPDRAITHWSPGAQALFGLTEEQAVGRTLASLIMTGESRRLEGEIVRALLADGRWEGEYEMRRSGAEPFIGYVRASMFTDAGVPAGFIAVINDVSDRVRSEQQLREARDELKAVTESMGEGLYTLDADGRLTFMNAAAEQMLGWQADELYGERVHDIVHPHRTGGEPFPSENPIHSVTRDGEPVRVEDDTFVRADGSEFAVSYTATPLPSERGSGVVVVFSDISDRKARQQQMMAELESLSQLAVIRDALDHERFELYAQPIVDVASGEAVQHELLIRLIEKDGTVVLPGVFLPAAERHGYIREIDRWVISEAADIAGRGHAVELNLSADSLGDPGLFEVFRKELSRANADPANIVIEITETALLKEEKLAQTFIGRIKALGCKIALDDFGTGYGGFTYLKHLPVDYLKLDREFVRDLVTNPASRHVVEAIVSLARGFGQHTVAEGVEDEETYELLVGMGVDFVQGYHLGRPAPLEQSIGRNAVAR